jgi:hypothetical protein
MALAVTITFCEVAENGPGMEKLGAERPPGGGLSEADLRRAMARLRADNIECELIDLVALGDVESLGTDAAGGALHAPDGPEPAYVLVMRNPLPRMAQRAGAPPAPPVLLPENAARDAALLAAAAAGAAAAAAAAAADPAPAAGATANSVFAEQQALLPIVDKKALFRGAVKNKNARHNLCFDDRSQEPAYEAGRGRIVPFAALPALSGVRSALAYYFGAEKATNLLAEGNYYYDVARTGIGFHGDGERRLVIALRLGAAIPLHYQWFYRQAPHGKRIVLRLGHGDMYAMSEKAVGTDWKRSVIPTLRHAAGAPLYLRTKQ